LTGSHSVYISDKGYYHDNLNILIEKSCSGFNFLLLCFCMLTLTTKHNQKRQKNDRQKRIINYLKK
jgi:hypothetical protein